MPKKFSLHCVALAEPLETGSSGVALAVQLAKKDELAEDYNIKLESSRMKRSSRGTPHVDDLPAETDDPELDFDCLVHKPQDLLLQPLYPLKPDLEAALAWTYREDLLVTYNRLRQLMRLAVGVDRTPSLCAVPEKYTEHQLLAAFKWLFGQELALIRDTRFFADYHEYILGRSTHSLRTLSNLRDVLNYTSVQLRLDESDWDSYFGHLQTSLD